MNYQNHISIAERQNLMQGAKISKEFFLNASPDRAWNTRYKNFMILFNKFKAENPELPDKGMLKAFAEKVGHSDRYLSHVKCERKNIGDRLARKIEESLGLPLGYMDTQNQDTAAHAADDGEKMFIETARRLYKHSPERARAQMMSILDAELAKQGKK